MSKYACSALYCLGLFLIITSSLKTESDLHLEKGDDKRELVEEVQNNTQTAKSSGLLTRGLQGEADGTTYDATIEAPELYSTEMLQDQPGDYEISGEYESASANDNFEDWDQIPSSQCFMLDEPSEVEIWCRFKNEDCLRIVTLAWHHSNSPQQNATKWCKSNAQCSNLVQYYHALEVGTGFNEEVDTQCMTIGEIPEATSWCTEDTECSSIVKIAWNDSGNQGENAAEWCKSDDQCDCLVKDYYKLNEELNLHESESDEKVVVDEIKGYVKKDETTYDIKKTNKIYHGFKKAKSGLNDKQK